MFFTWGELLLITVAIVLVTMLLTPPRDRDEEHSEYREYIKD